MEEPKCESCGVAWAEHPGMMALCDELQRAKDDLVILRLQKICLEDGEECIAVGMRDEIERLRLTCASVADEMDERCGRCLDISTRLRGAVAECGEGEG